MTDEELPERFKSLFQKDALKEKAAAIINQIGWRRLLISPADKRCYESFYLCSYYQALIDAEKQLSKMGNASD